MKWNKYIEVEPPDGAWILVFQEVSEEFKTRLSPCIKFIEYKRYGDGWKYLHENPEKHSGWTHWIMYKDFPIPLGCQIIDKK